MSRIVLNTFGSFGDLHPYLSVAIALKQRGHDPVVATAEVYRAKIEAEGVKFAPVRPDLGEKIDDKEFIRKVWDPVHGPEYLFRRYIMPVVEDSYEDLSRACGGADLLLSHSATYAAPVLAEKLNLPWLSVVLQPIAFLSTYDPPILGAAPWLRYLYKLGPGVTGTLLALAKRSTASWSKPVQQLRKRVGLPPSKNNPIFEGQYSPFGTLAWFSRYLAQPQKDWPPKTEVTGFPFYDKRGEGFNRWIREDTAIETQTLARFLEDGPPPVLFTLGSSAVMDPGTFYKESFTAALKLGVRAVLLVGGMPRDEFPPSVPDSICIATYAPYSEVMPKCIASVHQGGIGTTAQALRSGRPMIVVPWSHDQPDNAHRMEQLGVGRTVVRKRYDASRVMRELSELLETPSYAQRAQDLGRKVAAEDGIVHACDAIEALLKDGRVAGVGKA